MPVAVLYCMLYTFVGAFTSLYNWAKATFMAICITDVLLLLLQQMPLLPMSCEWTNEEHVLPDKAEQVSAMHCMQAVSSAQCAVAKRMHPT